MAKKHQRPIPQPSIHKEPHATATHKGVNRLFTGSDFDPRSWVLFPFLNFKVQAWLIVAIIFLCYGNSIGNKYAVDDGMVSVGNRFTKEGLKGIKDILTKDSFIGGMDKNVLPGGRYRPLSLVTFAIEWEFFGENPYVSHFLNIVFYALTCFLLLLLLRKYLFPHEPLIAFVATLIFAIHPIHIEAVTNIKGRDEVLAMLCMFGSLLLFFKYLNEHRKSQGLAFGAQFLYFLALLAKENPVTFLAIIPVTLYFFTPMNIKDALKVSYPFLITFVIYALIRIAASGLNTETLVKDVFQDPYFLVKSPAEKYATIMFVLGKYLALLFFPHPFSFDYTYNQIPYRDFSDVGVIISLLAYIGLAILVFWGWGRKNLYAYCAFFFIASISIVSNIVFNLGGMMGERFLFQPSIAFAIAFGAGLVWLTQKMNAQTGKYALTGVLVFMTTVAGARIFVRNQDWYSNETLYLKDVHTVPNSTRANKCAGEIYLRQAVNTKDSLEKRKKLESAIHYLEKSLRILPVFKEGFLDLGSAYCFYGELEKADSVWKLCDKYFPGNEFTGFYYTGVLAPEYGKKAYPLYLAGKYDEAMLLFQKAVNINPQYDVGWYYIGQIHGAKHEFRQAVAAFEKAIAVKKNEPEYYYHYGGACYMAGEYQKAVNAFMECKRQKPDFPRVDEGLSAAQSKLNGK
jgi:hypothetical protein